MTTVFKDKIARQGASGSLNGGYISEVRTLTTTDATATVIYSIPMALNTAISGRALVVGKKSDSSASIGAHITNFTSRRGSSGNVIATDHAIAGGETIQVAEDSAGTPAVTVVANTTAQTVEIKVAGIASETYYWEIFVEYIKA